MVWFAWEEEAQGDQTICYSYSVRGWQAQSEDAWLWDFLTPARGTSPFTVEEPLAVVFLSAIPQLVAEQRASLPQQNSADCAQG